VKNHLIVKKFDNDVDAKAMIILAFLMLETTRNERLIGYLTRRGKVCTGDVEGLFS
jgi:hypothetical protein